MAKVCEGNSWAEAIATSVPQRKVHKSDGASSNNEEEEEDDDAVSLRESHEKPESDSADSGSEFEDVPSTHIPGSEPWIDWLIVCV